MGDQQNYRITTHSGECSDEVLGEIRRHLERVRRLIFSDGEAGPGELKLEDTKWYTWRGDILAISEILPDHTIVVERGLPPDYSRVFVRNGAMSKDYDGFATIEYAPRQPDDLSLKKCARLGEGVVEDLAYMKAELVRHRHKLQEDDPRPFHFDCGNSSVGPVGFCAVVKAVDRDRAHELLTEALPESLKVQVDLGAHPDVEYIEVYLNADGIDPDKDISEENQ